MNTINIRCSMLSSYADCPRRAAAKQWRENITECGFALRELSPSAGAGVGHGFHSAARYIMECKRDTGMLPRISDPVDLAVEEYRRETETGVIYDNTTTSRNDAEKQISVITGVFLNGVAPSLRPVEIEKHRAALAETGFELTGTCDLETEENTIDDYKTGAKANPCQPQLGAYSLQRKSETKQKPAALRQIHIPRVSVKKPHPGPSVIVYDVDLCELAAHYTIRRVIADMKRFLESGSPWSFDANPMSMMCSDKYCPAWGTEWCELGGK